MTRISVVIPLYNKAPYIKRAIASILKQGIDDIEIIVVDGGSDDGGVEIVTGVGDQRIRLIHQKSKGVSEARNEGIAAAESDLIAFLDADDEWFPGFLSTILSLRERFPEAGLYATAYMRCEPDGHRTYPQYAAIPEHPWSGILPSYMKSAYRGTEPAWTSIAVIPKDVLERTGGFLAGKSYGEDVELWFRIVIRYPVAFSTEIGGIYHRDTSNHLDMSGMMDITKDIPVLETARIALEDNSISSECKDDIREYMTKLTLQIAYGHMIAGDIRNARTVLRSCDTQYFSRQKMGLLVLSYLPLLVIQRLISLREGIKRR